MATSLASTVDFFGYVACWPLQQFERPRSPERQPFYGLQKDLSSRVFSCSWDQSETKPCCEGVQVNRQLTGRVITDKFQSSGRGVSSSNSCGRMAIRIGKGTGVDRRAIAIRLALLTVASAMVTSGVKLSDDGFRAR